MWGDLLLKCSFNFAGANQTEIADQFSHSALPATFAAVVLLFMCGFVPITSTAYDKFVSEDTNQFNKFRQKNHRNTMTQ